MEKSSIGSGADSSNELNSPQIETALDNIKAERGALGQDIMDGIPDIPNSAVQYLAEHCPAPEIFSTALVKAREAVFIDPTAFDDPEIGYFVLERCLVEAKTAYREASKSDEERINDRKEVTLDSRLHIKNICVELPEDKKQGTQSIKLLRKIIEADLQEGKISAEVHGEALTYLAEVELTFTQMNNVFAGQENQREFTDILERVSLDFGAENLADTFAPVLKQVEASDKFTDLDKIKLRQIVTGSDAQAALRETFINKDGETQSLYTSKQPRDFRSGVSGYIQGDGRQIIEGRSGDHLVTKDVTGWSGEDVGYLIETMHFWNVMEDFGTAGFVENVYAVDFSLLNSGQAFDPLQIIRMRQVLSHLTTGSEGFDGDIADLNNHKRTLQNQARLLSSSQSYLGWENDREGTRQTLMRFGMQDENGNPNLDVIETFGDYSQRYFTGHPVKLNVIEHLHDRHPEDVPILTEKEVRNSRTKLKENRRNHTDTDTWMAYKKIYQDLTDS